MLVSSLLFSALVAEKHISYKKSFYLYFAHILLLKLIPWQHAYDLIRSIPMLGLTVEILGSEVEEFCKISSESISASISWPVAQISKNHIVFWKSVMRTFRCIYANCWGQYKIAKNTPF